MDAPILDFPTEPTLLTEPSVPSLAKKMALVMGELTRIEKNGKHPHYGYPYATSDDIFQAVRLAMAKHNLAIFPNMVSIRQEPVGKQVRTYGVFEFTFICGDTGESKVCPWQAEADDTQDKGINKVATAALKNFLLKAFVMSTGEESEDTEANPTPAEMPMTRAEFVDAMRTLGYTTEKEMADVLKTLDILHITGLKKYETMLDKVRDHKAAEELIEAMDAVGVMRVDTDTGEMIPPPADNPLQGFSVPVLDRAYKPLAKDMTREQFETYLAKVILAQHVKPSATEHFLRVQVKELWELEHKESQGEHDEQPRRSHHT